jgi:uncharacterized CHY-type Zn-finger protein
MGKIANDMVAGKCCSLCGQYFKNSNSIDKKEYEVMSGEEIYEHGYPVVCGDCWDELTKREKRGYQKAVVETL